MSGKGVPNVEMPRGVPRGGVSGAAISILRLRRPRGRDWASGTFLSASETPHGVPRGASLHWGAGGVATSDIFSVCRDGDLFNILSSAAKLPPAFMEVRCA